MRIKVTAHPAANIFPMMDAQQFADLKADIERNGLREPIVYFEGDLLDGRNRARACEELGIEPDEIDVDEIDDPIAYVLSANLHRRHLDPSQRAIAAAKAENFYAKEAKQRKDEGRKAGGKKRQGDSSMVENLPPCSKSRDAAGQAFGVSGRSVDHAKTVLNHGSKALQQAVEKGEIKVSRAAAVAKAIPKADQMEAAKSKRPTKPEPDYPLSDSYDRVTTDFMTSITQIEHDFKGLDDLLSRKTWDKKYTPMFAQQVTLLYRALGPLVKQLKEVQGG